MEENKADQETFADRKNINDLPNEILEKIFYNLRLKTIKKARFVCQRWNEVLHYTIGNKFLNGSADILNFLESIIHITQFYCSVCVHVCKECGSRCSEHKKFPRCDETKFNSVLDHFLGLYGDRVKTVGISHPEFCTVEAQNSLIRIAKYCPNIENVKIKFICIPESIKELMKLLAFSCPKIKRVCFIDISDLIKFSLDEFTYLFEKLPLKVFRLETIEATSDLPFISFPKSLQEFSLKTYKSDDSTALVKSLANSCPNLQRVSIKSEFSHELLDILAHRCPTITKLQFSFSEDHLNLRKFQNLKSVGLYM